MSKLFQVLALCSLVSTSALAQGGKSSITTEKLHQDGFELVLLTTMTIPGTMMLMKKGKTSFICVLSTVRETTNANVAPDYMGVDCRKVR